MKIVILMGSPNRKGSTSILAENFKKGAEENGHIINTFLESYDFSGKTIVLFATSGGSGIGGTAKALKSCVADDTKLIEGKVVNRGTSAASLKDWISGLEI